MLSNKRDEVLGRKQLNAENKSMAVRVQKLSEEADNIKRMNNSLNNYSQSRNILELPNVSGIPNFKKKTQEDHHFGTLIDKLDESEIPRDDNVYKKLESLVDEKQHLEKKL